MTPTSSSSAPVWPACPPPATSRRGGAQVPVLEARDRVGGRVEQVELADGRLVQLGGEVVGNAHTSYLGLVEELGLHLIPRLRRGAGRDHRQVLHENGRRRRLAVVVLR